MIVKDYRIHVMAPVVVEGTEAKCWQSLASLRMDFVPSVGDEILVHDFSREQKDGDQWVDCLCVVKGRCIEADVDEDWRALGVIPIWNAKTVILYVEVTPDEQVSLSPSRCHLVSVPKEKEPA